jgi:cyclohexanecarboxylate-CoA ligase
MEPMIDPVPLSLWQLIDARAKASPDVMMAIDEAGRTMTFAEYHEQCLRVAAALHERGVGVGTRVSWLLPSRMETFALVGALAYLGAVQNPMIPIYRHREVSFIARQTACELLITIGTFRNFDYPAMVMDATSGIEVNDRPIIVMISETGGLPEGDPSTLPPPARTTDDDLRWLFYSSGTTSDPKGARHTDATLKAANAGMQWSMDVTSEDRVAVVFPISHVGGMVWLFNTMQTGCRLLMVEVFDPVNTAHWLAKHDVTCAGAGTFFWLSYLAEQRKQPNVPLFPKVRLFNGGGAPKPASLHYDMKAAMKTDRGSAPLISGWGLTEAPILVMARPEDPDVKLAETDGRAVPGIELRTVVDGVATPRNVEGELQVKGPMVCKGYLDPALNGDAFADGGPGVGWFRSGDLGVIDTDGHVRITGRLKDIIIRKGENISAKDVEDQLFTHPSIADVAVIGLPDDSSGERACAVVVTAAGATPITFADMTAHLIASGLATFKRPEQLEIVDVLPRNPSGKVLKKDLRVRFGGRA